MSLFVIIVFVFMYVYKSLLWNVSWFFICKLNVIYVMGYLILII